MTNKLNPNQLYTGAIKEHAEELKKPSNKKGKDKQNEADI